MRRNRRWVGALVVGAACALAASCGGESGNTTRDASTDSPHADTGPDAPHADASHDGTHPDAAADVDAEACTNPYDFDASTLCCYTTIAEGCKHRQDCVPKWPGDPRAFCPGNIRVRDCTGYDVVEDMGTDTGSAYFYDIQSGDLVAIEDWDANMFSVDCDGPSQFTQPPCSTPWHAINCSDAGTDAADGAADAGGADAGGG